MTVCATINGRKRELCASDLDRIIKLRNRSITPPAVGSVDYTLAFEDKDVELPGGTPDTGEAWAMILTVSGKVIFDENNIERDVTHFVYIRYTEGVTAQTWVEFEGSRLDILDVEDLDERHEWLLLRCSDLGSASRSTTAA